MKPTFWGGLGVGLLNRRTNSGNFFIRGTVRMCDSCGCTPCNVCGAPIEDGVCSGCGEKPNNCTCEPLDEEFDYEEEEEEEEEDEDLDDEEDEDYEDEDDDEDDDGNW